ncbi:PaeR7I family type II restriction endonuclease [Kribbella sp. VKM Ac-2568]|uniref:PaeR7I family type II restriction endonuclease n=1 Tax=Kribbella sp. VKM Ac-2568 TaxID=2512219 RepID=UPI0010CF1DD0|nr:restriction endonuclease XhoI [Kribbella sp. VKM Ac-2568]
MAGLRLRHRTLNRLDNGRQGSGRPVYPPDPACDLSSYTDRYRLLFERLVRERLYDAACLISSIKGEGIHDEPALEVSTQNLTAAIAGRVAYIRGLI